MTGPKLPITRPAMPAVTAPPRVPTLTDVDRELHALRMDFDQAMMRIEHLESAASTARRGDEAQNENLGTLCARLDALCATIEAQGDVSGGAQKLLVEAAREATSTLTETRMAISRSPWAVAFGAGIVSALLGGAGNCAATRDIAREAATEAVREAPAPSVAVIVDAPPAPSASASQEPSNE